MLKKIAITISILFLCLAAFLVSAYVAGTIASPAENIPISLEIEASTPLEKSSSTSTVAKIEEAKSQTIEGTVLVGETRYVSTVEIGKTAYDLMEAARTGGFSFETEYFSGLGFFVTSIGGIKNDPSGGRYWTLYVNGERSNLGASNYILISGDSIEWKLEKN